MWITVIREEVLLLYARLQTGHIMVWWCLSVRVSVRQSKFSALVFPYMLWHIELKFCMSLSSYEHSIKFECRQFVNFCWSYTPFGTLNPGNTVFRTFLLHALTYWAITLNMTVILYYWSSSSVVNLLQFM